MVVAFGCGNAPRTPHAAAPARLYLVFFDLTRSLNTEQQRAVVASIEQLANGMPARSQVIVFPLGGYTQRAGVLVEQTLGDDRFATERSRLARQKKALPNLILGAAAAYTQRLTNKDFRRSTCISDALRQAEQVVKDTRHPEVEVIFISDMLEHCDPSLLGGMLSLEKKNISGELARAKRLDPKGKLVDLNGASVSALVPAAGPGAEKVASPALHVLREFWATVLSHCNHNTDEFFLDATFPSRLRPSR
jgi:hypothetical protein